MKENNNKQFLINNWIISAQQFMCDEQVHTFYIAVDYTL